MFGGTFSIMHWLVVLAVVLLLFGGRGKVSAIMGDFGKGLRNFKTGLKGDEDEAGDEADEVEVIEAAPAAKKAPAKGRCQEKGGGEEGCTEKEGCREEIRCKEKSRQEKLNRARSCLT